MVENYRTATIECLKKEATPRLGAATEVAKPAERGQEVSACDGGQTRDSTVMHKKRERNSTLDHLIKIMIMLRIKLYTIIILLIIY